MSIIPRTAQSAVVTLKLIVSSETYELGQVGPELLIFVNPTSLPPCEGEILMTIDGRVYRQKISLPDGCDLNARIVRTVAIDEMR